MDVNKTEWIGTRQMVITLQRNYSLQSRHISLWLVNADCEIISSTIAHGIAHAMVKTFYDIGWFLKRFHLVFFKHLDCQGRNKSNHGKPRQSAISVQVFMIFGRHQNHQNRTLKRSHQPKNHDLKVIFSKNKYIPHCCWTRADFSCFFLHFFMQKRGLSNVHQTTFM